MDGNCKPVLLVFRLTSSREPFVRMNEKDSNVDIMVSELKLHGKYKPVEVIIPRVNQK
jgi:hypothetical protein